MVVTTGNAHTNSLGETEKEDNNRVSDLSLLKELVGQLLSSNN